ncbi:hypothetical protein FN976_20515 [Caenimonas sedimenti]|uniref:DUF1444 family protein n=1 Tax=Caenimonas sedimenti TaxID=2596921 RepID=A0A562ZL19_9BURK|nr:hypothetical protein [Caenimonas sedimenti]TWO69121.1 hypothetical protein FN976_20515 [Caenimonas sedimenti]
MSFLKKLFSRKPTPAAAAAELIGRMHQLRPGMQFHYDAEQNVIRIDNGVISLANFYTDYVRANGGEREKLLHVFAQGVLPTEFPNDFATARPNLLPALRHLGGLEIARISSGIEGGDLPLEGCQPFSDELGIAVVYDTEHGIASVSDAEFKKWGVTLEEARVVAIDNLRQKAPPAFQEVVPGLYQSNYGDYYDAARVLLHEHIHQLAITGNPVVMAPNRSCLLVASDRSDQALVGMIRIAQHFLHNESRPLSAEMLRLIDGQWSPWIPTIGDAAQQLRSLQKQQVASDYNEQKAALDHFTQAKGIDVFVASHSLMQKEDGQLVSFCTLSVGVDTWLPRADVVMLIDPSKKKGDPRAVKWQAFEREAGHLLERLPYRLPRFKVTNHPDEATVARMEPAPL